MSTIERVGKFIDRQEWKIIFLIADRFQQQRLLLRDLCRIKGRDRKDLAKQAKPFAQFFAQKFRAEAEGVSAGGGANIAGDGIDRLRHRRHVTMCGAFGDGVGQQRTHPIDGAGFESCAAQHEHFAGEEREAMLRMYDHPEAICQAE